MTADLQETTMFAENETTEFPPPNEQPDVKKEKNKPRAKVSLEELFKDYKGDYKCEEVDWGPPLGNEVW